MSKLKIIKISDFIGVFIFLIVLPISIFYRLYLKIFNKHLWLVCEDKNTARDNGYHFFKYMRLEHPEIDTYYAIDKKCNGYKKVKDYGNIIKFGGFKHWLYYLSSEYNISNQKSGNPCIPLFYFIHVKFNLFNNRVFLQHGITKDDSPWLYYKNTKFKYFICGAKKEYDYISKKFGYPENNVIYTGFPRFDNLHDNKVNKFQILIMPTWRNWLGGNNKLDEINFKKSQFFIFWNSLLSNKAFNEYIEKNNLIVYFYPHKNMLEYLSCFSTYSKNIVFLDESYEIQKALKESSILITDYSSVYMDFAYMKKPNIYFQFDYEEYRKKQLQEGYFDYLRDGFGPVCLNELDVFKELKKIVENGLEKKYEKRMNEFFELIDSKNSDRIFSILINKKNGKGNHENKK